jgi:hypothetical protein
LFRFVSRQVIAAQIARDLQTPTVGARKIATDGRLPEDQPQRRRRF